jgi:AcrR family transcriptional regulator|tara:strand:- start:17635 stop:18912 length:1278 start_codon:yes stop_codon:yes gene_type:complete
MSDPASAPDDEERVIERILAAARDQILRHGLAGARVDQIARKAAVSKQTIYASFASKDDLFRAVMKATVARASAPDMPAVDADRLEQTLLQFARWVDKSMREPANLGFYRANIEAASTFPEMSASLHSLRVDTPPMLALIRMLQARAGFPPLDARRAANWFGVLAAGGIESLLGRDCSEAERQVRFDSLVHLFASGWSAPAPLSRDPAPGWDAPVEAHEQDSSGRTKASRWDAMLRLAFDRFADNGFSGTSVEQIASATGIAKMTIYRRYRSKDALFGAALHRIVTDLESGRPALAFEEDVASTLLAIAYQQDRIYSGKEYVRLARLLVTAAPNHEESVQTAWRRLTAQEEIDLGNYFLAQRDAGQLHLVDPVVAASQFLLLARRGNRRLTDEALWDPDDAMTHARDVVRLCLRRDVSGTSLGRF